LYKEWTPANLIDRHRELNKCSGAKGHLATPEQKSEKLYLKEEIVARSRQSDSECRKYALEREWIKVSELAAE
jgi:chromatin segregation and condensation protein Rec8/ScpA/Scc1 (kleisin family)